VIPQGIKVRILFGKAAILRIKGNCLLEMPYCFVISTPHPESDCHDVVSMVIFWVFP